MAKEDVISYAERITDIAFWDVAARLQPNLFVGMLYLCVLERASSPGERESWIARIRQGLPPAAALLEFINSAESRQAFPDRLMADVEDWARREAALSAGPIGQARPQIAWPLGADVRFNEDNPTT